MLVTKELVTVNRLVRPLFQQMSFKLVKNLFKLIYFKRASHKLYIVLQLAIFRKNNCVHKSDRLRLNVKSNRLLVSSVNIKEHAII